MVRSRVYCTGGNVAGPTMEWSEIIVRTFQRANTIKRPVKVGGDMTEVRFHVALPAGLRAATYGTGPLLRFDAAIWTMDH